MASQLIYAGMRLTAALLESIAPLAVIKGADESVVSSTVLQNDNDLVVAMAANATYLFECYLDYEGDSINNAGIQFKWVQPAGASMRYTMSRLETGSPASVTDASQSFAGASTEGLGSTGAGNLRGASMNGSVITSSTAGNLQLQWAQNVSSVTASIIHAQSYLSLWRVS